MTGNLFKSPCNIISSSNEKIADDPPQACGWYGQDKILACYNSSDTLPDFPGTLKIQISENSFWLQYVLSFLPFSGASPEPQITGDSESRFV